MHVEAFYQVVLLIAAGQDFGNFIMNGGVAGIDFKGALIIQQGF